MRQPARILSLLVVFDVLVTACGMTSGGGDGESHFVKCQSDEQCDGLGSTFACRAGECRESFRDAAKDAQAGDALPTRRESGADAPATPIRDASLERMDTSAPGDAQQEIHDGPVAPVCECPTNDYYVEIHLTGSGETERLSFPFALSLYCDETAPQFANPPCGEVYRVSACKGPQSAPPCVYVAVDGKTPVVGIYEDSSHQTYELVSASLPAPTVVDRVAVGSFNADFASKTSEATINIIGTFHACTTTFGPCRR
jgi:hypothetical protein